MIDTKHLRAYIAAPANVDTAVLRRLLDAENVVADDAFTISTGEDAVGSVVKRIRQADGVIAVFTEGGWTSYEVGVADALGKPVLVIAPTSTSLPSLIAHRQVLYGMLVDTDVLRLTLRKLIDEVRKHPRRLVSRSLPASHREQKPRATRDLIRRIKAARRGTSAVEVETLALEVLRAAGVTVAAQEPQNRDRGVDFAVLADALTATIGGPLLVELKVGKLSTERLKAAEAQLIKAMQAIGGRLGLVLYLDADDRRFTSRTWDTPYVLRFDLEDLAIALTQRSFASVVVEQRNRLVHGAG